MVSKMDQFVDLSNMFQGIYSKLHIPMGVGHYGYFHKIRIKGLKD